jgi:hypothetical protein
VPLRRPRIRESDAFHHQCRHLYGRLRTGKAG